MAQGGFASARFGLAPFALLEGEVSDDFYANDIFINSIANEASLTYDIYPIREYIASVDSESSLAEEVYFYADFDSTIENEGILAAICYEESIFDVVQDGEQFIALDSYPDDLFDANIDVEALLTATDEEDFYAWDECEANFDGEHDLTFTIVDVCNWESDIKTELLLAVLFMDLLDFNFETSIQQEPLTYYLNYDAEYVLFEEGLYIEEWPALDFNIEWYGEYIQTINSRSFLSFNHYESTMFQSIIAKYAFLSFNHYELNVIYPAYIRQRGDKLSMNYHNPLNLYFIVYIDQYAWSQEMLTEYIDISCSLKPGKVLVIDSNIFDVQLVSEKNNLGNGEFIISESIVHLHSGEWLFLDTDIMNCAVIANLSNGNSTTEHKDMIIYEERFL